MNISGNLEKTLRHVWARLKPRFRIIVDKQRMLGNFNSAEIGYRIDMNKEDISRRYILNADGLGLKFLDVGARDGALTYLLGIKGNFEFDEQFYQKNIALFHKKYSYYGMDLNPAPEAKHEVLIGDACDLNFSLHHPEFIEQFDVIYSNNVFEHFQRPWIAAENLTKLLKPGGIVITIVPFSARYHESPGDYFRFSHTGVTSLFSAVSHFEVLESGYDIMGRRLNWQGSGQANDIVPVDEFGAWRETWFTVSVLRKINLALSQ
jgi:SAM-dependent methyltransferase